MTGLSKIIPITIMLLLALSGLTPVFAINSIELVSPPPMDPAYPNPGSVTGRVTTQNASQGIPGAYVAIVNAADFSQAFYEGQADENGYYTFTAVNNTMTGAGPCLSYCVYANDTRFREGVSNPFAVWENTTATVNIVVPGFPHGVDPTPDTTRTSSGFIVEHVPMPDEVRLSAHPDTIMAGGNVSVITAQLYLNSVPYSRSGVTITFFTDNDTIGYLPAEKMIATDSGGRAMINLTSGNISGQVNVTGFCIIGISRNITGSCTACIESTTCWQSTVIDMNSTEASNTPEVANGSYENVTLAHVPENSAETGVPAAPGPAPSSTTGILYPALLILLVAVAGFTVYILAFRKK
ncbi:hypothetical protein [Methanocella sp. MCL-LM]|uniref:hypothetical protein n=1 Tax=Methanocella sp. MCL-LM TaxID=3412035 RepID=UPI003C72BF35